MLRSLPALVLLAALTFLLGLGRQAITDSDEAYYAEAAREMVESGDWLTPRYNYVNRWEKPVLYYWLTAATYLLTGPTEFSARLWSALSGVGLVTVTWSVARRRGGDARAAGLAGTIVATSFGYVSMARQALPDLPLTFCITLGIWAAIEATDAGAAASRSRAYRWWGLAGLAAGLGFLMKGPVALVVPGVVLLPLWWLERRRHLPGVPGLLTATVVFAVVGLPWYVAMWGSHGAAYLESFFIADNVERFATSRYNDAQWIWYYVPIVLGGLVPWSAYLALPWWRRQPAAVGAGDTSRDDHQRLLLWAAMPLLFYTASIGKQPRYILPVLPPLAILLARALAARVAHASELPDALLRTATLGTAALIAGATAALARAHLLFVHGSPTVLWLGVSGLIAGTVWLGSVAASNRWRQLGLAVPLVAAALSLTVHMGALAGSRPEPVETMANLVRMHRTAQEPVATLDAFGRSLVFYTGVRQRSVFDEAQAVAFLQSPERVLLILDEATVPAVERTLGRALPRLGRATYLNAGNVRLRSFLRPTPTEELTTVVLVSNR